MVITPAVFIMGDHQKGVFPVIAHFAFGISDGVINISDQLFTQQNRASGRRAVKKGIITRRVLIVVRGKKAGFYKRISGELAILDIIEEVVKTFEIRQVIIQ